MKRTLSFILTLCLLVGVVLPVSAEVPPTTAAFSEQVQYSVTDTNNTGWGLAFCFTLSGAGIKKSSSGGITLTNAALTYGGESCKVTRVGAVVTHLAGVAADDSRMVRETATGRREIKDVRVTRLYDATATDCRYAIRVINIPYEQEEDLIYARPYVEIEYKGEKVTLYGATDSASFADKLMESSLKLPFYGADIDGKGRITVGDTAVLCNTLYFELVDELDDWMVLPQDASTITLGFYDAAGALLLQTPLELPEMSSKNATELFEVELPEGTAEVKIDDVQVRYWTEWE